MSDLIVLEHPANTFTELRVGSNIVDADNVQHPWQIVDLWSDAHLAALNIYRVALAAPAPYTQVTGYSFQRVDGVVTQVLQTIAIPRSVTPRQIRLAMNQMGVRNAIEAWVKNQAQDVQDSWEFATELIEDNPLIAACMTGIGKTEADRTTLFNIASTIDIPQATAAPTPPPVQTVG